MSEKKQHHIRLHGPWNIELVTGRSADESNDNTVAGLGIYKLNFRDGADIDPPWSGGTGDVQWMIFSRRFNRPTGIKPDQKILLELELRSLTCAGTIEVELNECAIGSCPVDRSLNRFLLTDLQPSNVLKLKIQIDGGCDDMVLPPFKFIRLAM